jgi:hypothetical protein
MRTDRGQVVRSLAAPRTHAAIATAGSPSGHGETILVVEDEALVRALTP